MRSNFLKSVVATALLLVLAPATVLGQEACEAFVQQALNALGTNCANQDLNSICYGYNGVEASFDDGAGVSFSVPSDRASLQPLQSVSTLAYDEAGDVWGIAMMRVQANLPQSLPGQATVLLMMGNVSVENGVPSSEAVLPTSLVDVTVAQTTDLLIYPPNFGNNASASIGVAASGEVFQADGITADGSFVRVYYEYDVLERDSRRATAWVSVDSLEAFDSSSLTSFTASSLTPMQVFTVTTGIGEPRCGSAPDQLFVQGPDNIETEIVINQVNVTIASTIIVRSVPGGVIVIAISGSVVLTDDEGDTVTLEPGQVFFIPVDDSFRGNIGGGNFTDVDPDTFGAIESLPPNILNYTPDVPEFEGGASGVGQ